MRSSATMFTTRLPILAAYLATASGSVLELPILFKNTYALVEVSVGTPATQHFLRFDTGSATTWIVDEHCAEDTCLNYSQHPRNGYNLSASSTGSSLGTYAAIQYLGGVTGGPGVSDIFAFPSSPDLAWNQTFMAANESSWSVMPADGFLGLAFSSIADAGTKTLVETLMQDGKLDEPRFSIYYGKEYLDRGDFQSTGFLTLGTSEEEKYVEGDMTWVEPLQQVNGETQLWRTNMVALTSKSPASNGSTERLFFNSAWAVFDTGAGSITIPESQAPAVYASIGMNWTAIIRGDHIPLCTEFTSDWSVTFEFGDYLNPVTVTLTGDQLARPGFADGSPEYCWPPFDPGDSDGLWLFGTPFLHLLYSVFDFGAMEVANYKPRVGFGQLKAEFRA